MKDDHVRMAAGGFLLICQVVIPVAVVGNLLLSFVLSLFGVEFNGMLPSPRSAQSRRTYQQAEDDYYWDLRDNTSSVYDGPR